jgi:hypothetical protein
LSGEELNPLEIPRWKETALIGGGRRSVVVLLFVVLPPPFGGVMSFFCFSLATRDSSLSSLCMQAVWDSSKRWTLDSMVLSGLVWLAARWQAMTADIDGCS